MTSIPDVVVTAAVVARDGTFLVTRRPEGTPLAGSWEFPGGKCGPGETLDECLRREILEELGVNVAVGPELLATVHQEPHQRVRLHFFSCELLGTPRPSLGQEMRWVGRDELRGLDFPEADAELIRLLEGPPLASADDHEA